MRCTSRTSIAPEHTYLEHCGKFIPDQLDYNDRYGGTYRKVTRLDSPVTCPHDPAVLASGLASQSVLHQLVNTTILRHSVSPFVTSCDNLCPAYFVSRINIDTHLYHFAASHIATHLATQRSGITTLRQIGTSLYLDDPRQKS